MVKVFIFILYKCYKIDIIIGIWIIYVDNKIRDWIWLMSIIKLILLIIRINGKMINIIVEKKSRRYGFFI